MTPTEVDSSNPSKSSEPLSPTSPTSSENIQSTPSGNETEDDSHPVGVQERPGKLDMGKIFEADHDGDAEEAAATDRSVDWYDKLVGSTSSVNGKQRDEQACEVISIATVGAEY